MSDMLQPCREIKLVHGLYLGQLTTRLKHIGQDGFN